MECLDFWGNDLFNSKDHRKYVSSAVRVHSLHLVMMRGGGKIATVIKYINGDIAVDF